MATEANPTTVFVAGATVTISGIYRVEHAGCPRPTGESVLVAGMVLPQCPECGPHVLYTLLRSAPSPAEDADFEKS